MVELFSLNASLLAILFSVLWLLSILIRDVSIVDIAWGSAFVVVAWTSFLSQGNSSLWDFMMLGAVSLWGLRLSIYLAFRNLGKGEDKRYAVIRQNVGPTFWIQSLYMVFALQGILVALISLPIQAFFAIDQQSVWEPSFFLGLVFWMLGILFEGIGDEQLRRFKSLPQNQGAVMNQGLWRYTRHPNYFGDFCVWWGFFFMAIARSHLLWLVVSPALMSYLLIRVSGVKLLEKDLNQRKPEYQSYITSTSPFFPWFPKRG